MSNQSQSAMAAQTAIQMVERELQRGKNKRFGGSRFRLALSS